MVGTDDRIASIGGMPSEEDIVLFGPGCQMGCTFCPHSGGRAGHRMETVLAPDFRLPLAHRVTILAGDVVRKEVAPLVSALRAQGSVEVFAYAHPGTWDLDALDELTAAGLTGIQLMLPAARKAELAALTGGKGSLVLVARLIDHANRRLLRVAAEIPVVESSATLIDDTVERFLKITALPDRVALRFVAEFHPVRGPVPWDHSIATPHVAAASALCRGRQVPLILAHPEAPPPCVMDVPDASAAIYPGLSMYGIPRGAPRPFAACGSCAAAAVCHAEGRFLGGAEPVLTAPLALTGTAGSDAPGPVAGIRPERSRYMASEGTDRREGLDQPDTPGPNASTIWRRQADLNLLRVELERRRITCRYPWEQLEAHDIRGVVTPCAGGWPLESTVNDCVSWHGGSLLTAWNSPGMQNTRRAVAAGRAHDTCKRDCPAFHGGPMGAVPSMSAPTTGVMFDNIIDNVREMLDGATVLQSRPQSISFSPTMRCTNRCRMCDIHEVMEAMGRPAEIREMPDSLFDELLELLPTTRMLALTGGEPLVSKRMRDLLKRFSAERYPDGAVTITTNGQLLRENILRDLSGTRIRQFYVSLNAADDAMYEHVSGIPGGFTRVRNHLALLMDMAPRMAGRPGVIVSFVVMRSNFMQLAAFLDLALGLKTGIRLLPIERDRMGESIFTDEPTLAAVHAMLTGTVMPSIERLPWGYRAEIARLFSIIDGRLSRRDFSPL